MSDAPALHRWIDLAREPDFALGALTVRPRASEVLRVAGTIRLQPRIMQVLVALARADGELVTRDALVDACWGLAVGDDAINRCIGRLRRLAEEAPGSFAIETLPRIGYRLTARGAEGGASVTADADVVDDALAAARAALDAREWETAFQQLAACDARRPLGPLDLERLHWAGYWTSRCNEAISFLERAEVAFRRAGDARGAARAGLHLYRLHAENGSNAVAGGYFQRTGELLATITPECPEHALHAAMLAYLQIRVDTTAAEATAARAREIARRVGDRNSEALGLLYQGRCRITAGDLADGLAHLDEATAAATSGELDPWYSGYIYCSVINSCADRADWQRAAEWSDRADRWCARESIGFYPGICLVHRATIMRLRGELLEAEANVLRGLDLILASSPAYALQAYLELAEIRFRLGDLAGADAACRGVVEYSGMEAQPVLARLRLERGDPEGALTSLDRTLASPLPFYLDNHIHLLPAMVSIRLACGRAEAAAEAMARLDALATRLGSPAALAAATRARGEVDLAGGRHTAAIAALRLSLAGWIEERAPYEAAGVRCLLATALEREGDLEAADLELELAQAAFERIGARLEAQRTGARLSSRSRTPAG